MSSFVKVANVEELESGGRLLLEIDDRRLALFNIEGQYYAIDDICTHDGGPLAEGAHRRGALHARLRAGAGLRRQGGERQHLHRVARVNSGRFCYDI